MFSPQHHHRELCTAEKSCWCQRHNTPACLSPAQPENQQTAARQFRAHSKSSCPFCHLPTLKWSQFSVCCTPLPLPQSPSLTSVENLRARYSLPSCSLSVTHWRYSSCHRGLHSVLSSESLHEGAPHDSELLLSARQIRPWLQLHKPREMQVKHVSARSTNSCRLEGRFYSKITRHIHPVLSLTSTGRCFQAPSYPKHTNSSAYTGSAPGLFCTARETCGRHWDGRAGPMEISTSTGKKGQWLSFPLLPFLILFLLGSSGFCSLPIYS